MKTSTADDLIDRQLKACNVRLSKQLGADVLFIKAPIAQPIDDVTRSTIEALCPNGAPKDRLAVIVETTGGYIETVERIVGVFRTHYENVDFIVPNYAYSAGTVLVLSGDEIYMDYHSILGPIDPQYESDSGGGNYVPGLGYLAKYNELVQTINAASNMELVKAELAYLVQKFDPAKLYHIEQAIEHSKSLLKDWLPKYKFKNWAVKASSGAAVTMQDKQDRADEIAEVLGDASRWHSHGRGITLRDLASEEIKLKVVNFGENPLLNKAIRDYYVLMVDYMSKRRWSVALHTRHGIIG